MRLNRPADSAVKLYASLVGAERWPYQREPVVLEHDAKCRLLVERLRGEGNLTISNARFWFLTYDTKLPRFAERVPDNGDEAPGLPFCISPSAWVQITRALTPRTEDFDRTVVDLLTSPFVGYRPGINSAVVQEVVGRMDHFEDASPEMAFLRFSPTPRRCLRSTRQWRARTTRRLRMPLRSSTAAKPVRCRKRWWRATSESLRSRTR